MVHLEAHLHQLLHFLLRRIVAGGSCIGGRAVGCRVGAGTSILFGSCVVGIAHTIGLLRCHPCNLFDIRLPSQDGLNFLKLELASIRLLSRLYLAGQKGHDAAHLVSGEAAFDAVDRVVQVDLFAGRGVAHLEADLEEDRLFGRVR